MLETNSYDTICHEHLEYYSIEVLNYMCEKANLKIIGIEFNSINGGSFIAKIAHKNSCYQVDPLVEIALQKERLYFSNPLTILKNFSQIVLESKNKIHQYFSKAYESGKIVVGLGESTKGNVLLQYCEINEKYMPMIFEVNSDKYGKKTPGTKIPICPETELSKNKVDELFVLPWHFKDFFMKIKRLKKYDLIFPLPILHKIHKN